MNLPAPKQESVSENTHVSPAQWSPNFCWCYPANFQPRHQQFHACCIESAPLCSSKCHRPGRNTELSWKSLQQPRILSDFFGFWMMLEHQFQVARKLEMFESTHVTKMKHFLGASQTVPPSPLPQPQAASPQLPKLQHPTIPKAPRKRSQHLTPLVKYQANSMTPWLFPIFVSLVFQQHLEKFQKKKVRASKC